MTYIGRKTATQALRTKHSRRTAFTNVRIVFGFFQELYKYLIYIGNFIEPNLAKVGVEGSNPFARSNDFNDLGDNAFVAQSGVAACALISVLIRTPA
jgi:hypothetical protein